MTSSAEMKFQNVIFFCEFRVHVILCCRVHAVETILRYSYIITIKTRWKTVSDFLRKINPPINSRALGRLAMPINAIRRAQYIRVEKKKSFSFDIDDGAPGEMQRSSYRCVNASIIVPDRIECAHKNINFHFNIR